MRRECHSWCHCALHSTFMRRLSSVGFIALSSFASQLVVANDWAHGSREYNRHVYVATGLGVSHLDPDTSEVSDEVNDHYNRAGQITIGVDVNPWLSLEMHSADLGSAGLESQHRINYRVHGFSGLLYFGKNRDQHARHGLSTYARLGLGYLENSAVGDVRYERDNAMHVLFGGGVEYASEFGLAARLELFSFDRDAVYAQFGLVYRFGRREAEQRPSVLVSRPVVEKPIEAPAVAAIAIVHSDQDEDGIPNELDACPATRAGVSVNSTGCVLFDGVAEGVNFFNNSATLTSDAKAKLDEVVAILLMHRNVNITISAHTDDRGEAEYNHVLSQRRAKAVVRYLLSRGIDLSRLAARAYGEKKPIDSNRTAAGRERNRRVEIVIHREDV